MSFLYKLFPRAMRADDMMDMVMALALYLLAAFAAGIAVMLLCFFVMPLSGLWFLLGGAAGLYTVAGMVISVLHYLGVL